MYPLRPALLVGAALLAASCCSSVFAQSHLRRSPSSDTIEGTVTDARTHRPLTGVHVVVTGTATGTTTDLEGQFRLASDSTISSVTFSYVGYRIKTVAREALDPPVTIRLQPTYVDLRSVVVSASREVEARTEAPVAIASLPARELESTKPNMLYQALNTVPGVHTVNLGNEQHTMSIRQPLSYKALYLYLMDGIPIRPVGIFNHNALIEVNMAALRSVEVIRGPSSVLYGSNAVGGAVNFLTPRPSTRPTAGMDLRASNYGYQRVDGTASTTVGDLGVWAGGYAARRVDGWSAHSNFQKLSLSAKARYAIQPTTYLTTTLSTNHFDTDTNGSLDSLSFHSRDVTSLQTFTFRKVRATRVTSRFEHVWSGRHSTDLTAYFRENAIGQLPHYRIRTLPDPARAWGEVNENSFWSLGLVAQHRMDLDWRDARWIVGASLDRSPNSYVAHYIDIARNPQTGRYTEYTRRDSLLTDYDVSLVNAAGYTQFGFSPLARLKVIGSLRFDHISYGYDNHLPPSAFSGAPDERTAYHQLSPGLGFTYDLGAEKGLYGNYNRGFRPPEVGELFRGVTVPVLQPAFFDSYELGGWITLPDSRLRAEGSIYLMNGKDEIISVRRDDGSRVNRNAGNTRHVGVEYGLTYAPSPFLSIEVTGTNARHTFLRYEESGETLNGNEMNRAPSWIVHASTTYRPSFLEGARLVLEWQHVGPYFMDARNTLQYDGHDLFGFRMGYRSHGMEIWANIYNLTNTLYATIAEKSAFGQQYTLGPPRRVTVGIGYSFGQSDS